MASAFDLYDLETPLDPYGSAYEPFSPTADLSTLSDEELNAQIAELEQRQIEAGPSVLEQYGPAESEQLDRNPIFDPIVSLIAGVPEAASYLASIGSLVPGVNVVADPVADALMGLGELIKESGYSDYQKMMSTELAARIADARANLPEDAEIGDYVDNIIAQGGEVGQFALENPAQIVDIIAGIIPSMFAGPALVGRTAQAGKAVQGIRAGVPTQATTRIQRGLEATPVLGTAVERVGSKLAGTSGLTRGALGEGIIATGASTYDIAEATRDEGYTLGRLMAVPVGLTTAGITRGIGRLAGEADIDRILGEKIGGGVATDLLGEGATKTSRIFTKPLGEGRISRAVGTTARVGRAGATEGLEEALQSTAETALTNIGAGRPALEDIGANVALGTLAGAGMGAPFGLRRPASLRAEDAARAAQLEAEANLARAQAAGEVEQEGVPTTPAAPARNVNKPTATFIPGPQWESVKPQLDAANTPEEAEQVIRDAGFVFKNGELSKRGNALLTAWRGADRVYREGLPAEPTPEQVQIDEAAQEQGLGEGVVVATPEPEDKTEAAPVVEGMPSQEALAADEQELEAIQKEFEAAPQTKSRRSSRKKKQKELAAIPQKPDQFTSKVAGPAKGTMTIPDKGRSFRALAMAIQGYLPSMAERSTRQKVNNAWKSLANQSRYIAELDNGQELLNTLDTLHNQLADLDAAEKTAAGTYKRATEKDQAKGVAAQKKLSKDIAASFAKLESLVGRDRMFDLLDDSKYFMATLRGKVGKGFSKGATTALPASGNDASGGVRLSRAYKAYRNGRLEEQFIPVEPLRFEQKSKKEGTAPPRPKAAKKKEDVAKSRRDSDVSAEYSRVEQIADADITVRGYEKRQKARKGVRSRAAALLDHFAAHSKAPYALRLAGDIKTLAAKLGLLDENRIKIVINNDKDAAKDGSAATTDFNKDFDVRDPNSVYATITLYKNGHSNVHIIHEMIHVVATGALKQKSIQNSIAYKNLQGITRLLTNMDNTKVRSKFGDETAAILASIKKLMNKDGTSSVAAVSEMLSYGMTNEGIQRLMMDLPITATKLQDKYRSLGDRLSAVWNKFLNSVKKIFGSEDIKNTQFERFMFASTALLNRVENSKGQLKAVDIEQLAAIGAMPPAPNAAVDPEVSLQDPKTRAAAEKATKARLEADEKYNQARRDRIETQEKERKAKEKAAVEAFTGTPEARARKEEERKRRESTVVLASSKTRRDVTWLDRVERNTLNWVASAFPNSTGDYETDISNALRKGSEGVQAFLKKEYPAGSPMYFVQRIANTVGGGIVDRYGTPDAAKNQAYRVMKNLSSLDANISINYESIVRTMPKDHVYALLEYLDTGSDAAIKTILKDPSQVEVVKKLGKMMNETFQEAKALGMVPTETFAKGATFTLADFIYLYANPDAGRSARMSVRKLVPRATEGVVEGKLSAVLAREPIPSAQVLGKDGDPVSRFNDPTARYFQMLDKDGDIYYVDTRMDNATKDKKGLLPDVQEGNNTYRVRGVKGEAKDVIMSRLRTQEELEQAKVLDNLTGSLAANLQNWGRVVETKKYFDTMLEHNNRLKEDAWIVDGLKDSKGRSIPFEGVDLDDKVQSNRYMELSLRQSNFTKMREFGVKEGVNIRSPGHWVRIPDTADVNTWGDLRGKWISGPVYASIIDLYDNTPVVDSALMRSINTLWKKNVTVFSPVAHVNNVGGNFVLSYAHDIPWRNIKTGFRLTMIKNLSAGSLAKMGIKPTKQDYQLIQEINDMGIELITFRHADLDSEAKTQLEIAFKKMNGTPDDNSKAALLKGLIQFENVMATLKKYDTAFTQVYSEQDNIFRIAAYKTKLEHAYANNGKITEADKEAAGQYARAAFVDYNIKAPWINALRQGRFVGLQLPFIAWTYRMVPIMAKIAITKPWKLANIIGAISAMNSLSYALLGVDDDDRKNQEALVPDMWANSLWGFGPPGYIRLPWGSEDKGNVLVLGNMIPLSNIFEFKDEEILPGTFMPGGPGLVATQWLFNYDFFRGKEISGEFSQDYDRTEYLFRQMSPRILSDVFTVGTDAITDRKNALYQDVNYWARFVKMMGINMREIDWNEQEYFRELDVNRMGREAKKEINATMRDYYRNGTDPNSKEVYDKLMSIYEELDEKTRKKYGL